VVPSASLMNYWAHSDPDGLPAEQPDAQWQPLSQHLVNVSQLSRRLAQAAAPGNPHFHDLVAWSGLLHDFGKYSDCFQQMILTGKGRCQHAIHGATIAQATIVGLKAWQAPHMALAIAGHHAGLPDLKGGGTSLEEKLKAASQEAYKLRDRAAQDSPELKHLLESDPPVFNRTPLAEFDLLTRMIFSCLVDADRLDTAKRQPLQQPLRAAERLDTLLAHVERLSTTSPEGVVKSARREILQYCLAAAELPGDLRSLSVPTGGGKTLSAMAYALKRAAVRPNDFRRIIVVIPFLSIIEQNAEVYSRLFGPDAVLEHHSGTFDPLASVDGHFIPAAGDQESYLNPATRPETENWDAPLIVTTSVRFFESLFSNHPSDLRRVHNIARSIVILDEVQVLPRHLLAPLLDMMRELTTAWRCSFVLSTATKPAFEKPDLNDRKDFRWPPGTLKEIVGDPPRLHSQLRRVTIDWRIRESADWPEVASWMLEQKQSLCVVNLRRHAVALYDCLRESLSGQDAGLFHLSTRMCAAHRLLVIARIRERLANGEPCTVVSTQLIEAGVDLDFPIAFRALGPLDSIVQVAGRADREGLLTAAVGSPAGRLIVFKPADNKTPPGAYENATTLTETMALQRSIQSDDLPAMERFFERYYTEGGDTGANIQELRKKFCFRTLADEFEMISSRTQDVFVPFGEGKQLITELTRIGQLTAGLRRKLQRYTVGLQPWEFQEARRSVLAEVRPDSNIWFAVDPAYNPHIGLQLTIAADQFFA
jgi:CRISPR-associated endonuclease/helicase Cas3